MCVNLCYKYALVHLFFICSIYIILHFAGHIEPTFSGEIFTIFPVQNATALARPLL